MKRDSKNPKHKLKSHIPTGVSKTPLRSISGIYRSDAISITLTTDVFNLQVTTNPIGQICEQDKWPNMGYIS